MIKLSIEAGADFLKFQTYKAETRYDKITNPKAGEFIKLLKSWELSEEENIESWDYANLLAEKCLHQFMMKEKLNLLWIWEP